MTNDIAHLQWCKYGYHFWEGGHECKVCGLRDD